MLLAFAALALWMSTFSGYAAAFDVRKAILLAVLIASGCAAIRFEGRNRAFWGGFCVAMFMHGFTTVFVPGVPTPHVFGYAPNLDWCDHLANRLVPYVASGGSNFYPAWFNQRKPKTKSTTTLIILTVVLFLVFGGGGYYMNCGR